MSASLAVPLVLVGACDRSAADAQTKAIAAQREADQTIAKAQHESEQHAAEALEKTDESGAKARDQLNQDTSKARANANTVIRNADESTLEARSDIREWAQKKLDSTDGDIDRSKTKVQTASTKVKQSFSRVLEDCDAKRVVVQNGVASLDTQTGAALDQSRASLDKELAALESCVTRLKVTL